jgi:hypothetical protein
MFKFLFLFLVSFSAVADEWTTEDTYYQTAFTVLTVIDARYTQDIVRHSNQEEKNPILGNHPSNSRINTYFSTVLVSHAVIAYLVPSDIRRKMQQAGIAVELGADVNNFNMGLSIGF